MRCACGHEWELHEPAFRCPRCAGGEVTVLSGEELTVDSIEVEETDGENPGGQYETKEEPCTAAR